MVTNFISEKAKIGDNVQIWHFSYVGDNTEIGDNVSIGSLAHIDYDVKIGEWKSSADRSPFHTKFMKKSLTPKMRNEVRILKTFLKSNRRV